MLEWMVSRFFHALVIFGYVALFVLAVISMSAFANLHLDFTGSEVYAENRNLYGKCILNGEYSSMLPNFRLNNDTNSCRYARPFSQFTRPRSLWCW